MPAFDLPDRAPPSVRLAEAAGQPDPLASPPRAARDGEAACGRARLLADIGGTHARFAWQADADAPIDDVMVLPCAQHASLADALRAYLAGLGRAAPPQAALAIATPVTGDRVRMTNHPWSFSTAALRAEFGFERLHVLNDFAALALALPALRPSEVRRLGGGAPAHDAAVALIGPGTGLGVSGLVPDGRGGWVPLQGEGGHATLAACTPREQAVIARLAERYGHVSAERAVCGQGLVDLHGAVQSLDAPHVPPRVLDAPAVVREALEAGDPCCLAALDLFCGFLGTAAGNLALTLGARGGVYVGGGIVPRLGAFLDRSPFRRRFEAKGRFAPMLAAIPVYVILARQPPALRGAARALDARA